MKNVTQASESEKTSSRKKSPKTQQTTEKRQPRINEKARQRTRNRLLKAARSVMAKKGIESTAIGDITAEAELSLGCFYNYFSTKEEVARAVFIEDALKMIAEFDANMPDDVSIAERVGVNIRRTLQHGLTDPVWGWFLVHSMYSINDMISTMGNPLARDIKIGNEQKVFDVSDIDATVDCIMGGMVFLLRKILQSERSVTAIESLVQYILRGMGVEDTEVTRIIQIDIND